MLTTYYYKKSRPSLAPIVALNSNLKITQWIKYISVCVFIFLIGIQASNWIVSSTIDWTDTNTNTNNNDNKPMIKDISNNIKQPHMNQNYQIERNLLRPSNSFEKSLYQSKLLEPYCSDVTNTQQCIDHIVSNVQPKEAKIHSSQENLCRNTNTNIKYFHTFWAGNDVNHDAFILFVTSFLATQNDCTSLIIWTSSKSKTFETNDIMKIIFNKSNINISANNKILKHLIKRIIIKPFILSDFGYIGGSDIAQSGGYSAIASSDIVRFFALNEYGGIYLDSDSMFLKDFYPLWDFDFLYKWGNTKNVNTAVLGLHKKSKLSKLFVKLISQNNNNNLQSASHPHAITKYMQQYDLTNENSNANPYGKIEILPIILFDGYWLYNDGNTEQTDHWLPRGGFEYFIKTQYQTMLDENRNIDQLYPASFSYHIHNSQVMKTIPKGTIGDAFVQKFQAMLRQKVAN